MNRRMSTAFGAFRGALQIFDFCTDLRKILVITSGIAATMTLVLLIRTALLPGSGHLLVILINVVAVSCFVFVAGCARPVWNLYSCRSSARVIDIVVDQIRRVAASLVPDALAPEIIHDFRRQLIVAKTILEASSVPLSYAQLWSLIAQHNGTEAGAVIAQTRVKALLDQIFLSGDPFLRFQFTVARGMINVRATTVLLEGLKDILGALDSSTDRDLASRIMTMPNICTPQSSMILQLTRHVIQATPEREREIR